MKGWIFFYYEKNLIFPYFLAFFAHQMHYFDKKCIFFLSKLAKNDDKYGLKWF